MKKLGWLFLMITFLILGIGGSHYSSDPGLEGNLVLKPFQEGTQNFKEVVITVNDQEISLDMLLEQIRKQGGHLPGQFETEMQREQLMDELIHFELLAQEAEKLNYHNDPEVQLAYKKILVSKFRKEQIQTELSQLIITEEKTEDYYKEHHDRYTEPAMRRLAMIFLRSSANQTLESLKTLRQKAEKIRVMAKHQKSKDFGKLAAKYSDDLQSKFKGGTLTWISKKSRNYRLDPKIITSAFKLKKISDLSPIIETKNGYYLLKLIDLRNERIKPLKAVKLQIQADLKAEQKQLWLNTFNTRLKNKAEIKLNQGLLNNDKIWEPRILIASPLPSFPVKQ